MIAVDMRKRNEMYIEMIEGDVAKMESMGMRDKMHEINVEL